MEALKTGNLQNVGHSPSSLTVKYFRILKLETKSGMFKYSLLAQIFMV